MFSKHIFLILPLFCLYNFFTNFAEQKAEETTEEFHQEGQSSFLLLSLDALCNLLAAHSPSCLPNTHPNSLTPSIPLFVPAEDQQMNPDEQIQIQLERELELQEQNKEKGALLRPVLHSISYETKLHNKIS
jgi:hypothetical protein